MDKGAWSIFRAAASSIADALHFPLDDCAVPIASSTGRSNTLSYGKGGCPEFRGTLVAVR
jgi:hypothetical protein